MWRDTPVRLLGYANEIGESFRYIFPKAYKPSYIVATGYCFADVVDKGIKTYRKDTNIQGVIINSVDAMIWQLLASVFVPGFIINRTVEASTFALTRL